MPPVPVGGWGAAGLWIVPWAGRELKPAAQGRAGTVAILGDKK